MTGELLITACRMEYIDYLFTNVFAPITFLWLITTSVYAPGVREVIFKD